VCFLRLLLDSKEMQAFDRARVFLDEDFTAVEKFTVSIKIFIAKIFSAGAVYTVRIFLFLFNRANKLTLWDTAFTCVCIVVYI